MFLHQSQLCCPTLSSLGFREARWISQLSTKASREEHQATQESLETQVSHEHPLMCQELF